MSLKLKWKPKPIFYCYGNAQRFADDSLTAKMTGEPLPKTWQEFFELTPEQKAQWDAELKLDAEYRIAEAQGFPNGIPGGKERGSIFYFLAQREKEYKRECEEVQEEYAKDQEKHFSLRQKTDILGENKWVMEYEPYGTSPKHEPMEPLILPKEDFLMKKYELKYDTDALNNVIRNAAAKSTPNVNSAASWWQAMDQSTYNFSRNIYDDYRQNDGETNVWDAWNYIANSSAYNGGMTNGGNAVQNSTGGKFTEDGRLGEVFVTKEGAETVWQSVQSVYDAMQEYGISVLSVAGNFVSEWGEAYGETLLKKIPFPPQARMMVTALFLAKKVYEVARGVADKHDAMTKSLEGKVSPKQAKAMADAKVGEWLSEEIGKVVIEEGLDVVLAQIPDKNLRGKAKDAIIGAWNTFIEKAEAGTWERGVVH